MCPPAWKHSIPYHGWNGTKTNVALQPRPTNRSDTEPAAD